jgi:hypothetical protein
MIRRFQGKGLGRYVIISKGVRWQNFATLGCARPKAKILTTEDTEITEENTV